MEIKVATTMDELEAVAAARYDVFIREGRSSAFFADNTRGLLLEPEDAFNESTVIYAQEKGKIVASVRVEHRTPNWLLRQIDRIPNELFYLRSCFCMWAYQLPSAKGERYLDSLFLTLMENFKTQYELAFLTCKSELIDLYAIYAFQKTGYIVEHPDTGTRHLLAILACSNGLQGTRYRSFGGQLKYELSMERKAELYRWLKL